MSAVAVAADIGTWRATPPGQIHDALVVVAPHPDDEVLGAGMTMVWWQQGGGRVIVVACTDGEASHARSSSVDPDDLRERRAGERSAAFDRLNLTPEVVRLGLPDGGLSACGPDLAGALAAIIPDAATLLVPWEGDDHPDHRAVAAAGASAARERGVRLWRAPVWGKVRGGPPPGPGAHRLHLSGPARETKGFAAAAFTSQLESQGPEPEDGPVVHPAELAAMLDGTEVILC